MSQIPLPKFIKTIIERIRGSKGSASIEKLSGLLSAAARKFNVPGISVAVYFEGKEFFASSGLTNIGKPQPVDKDTLFMVASVTKTFTASAIMHLVAIGKVDINVPVSDLPPEIVPVVKLVQTAE